MDTKEVILNLKKMKLLKKIIEEIKIKKEKRTERKKIKEEIELKRQIEVDNFAKTILAKLKNMDKTKLRKIRYGYSYDDVIFIESCTDGDSGFWSDLTIGQDKKQFSFINKEIYNLCERKYNELIEDKISNMII